MQSDRRITRSMSASNSNISTQTEMEKINNEIETIENTINSLQQQLNHAKKIKHELEPTITVTDEYSGRTFILKKNSYELSLKYLKVHPITGQRLYTKTEHWRKSNYVDKYCVYTCMNKDFPDTEYAENTWDGNYQLYNSSVGWSRPGYYWYDNSSDYDYQSHYFEKLIPINNPIKKRKHK